MTKRKLPKDTGIFKSNDGKVVLSEKTRDGLAKITEQSILDGIKSRAPSPETMTTKELEAINWSGIRSNMLSGYGEAWVHGKVRAKRKLDTLARDPSALADMLEEAFGEPVMVIVDAQGGPSGTKH